MKNIIIDLNLKIFNDKLILRLEKIFFSNFGNKKNSIEGKIFGKKFKAGWAIVLNLSNLNC